ncbi:MAG TPA: hypothetical protein VGG35_16105 [Streptosporangiaceae bacterium]
MLGVRLLAALILSTLIGGRLAAGGIGSALSVPARWIVLGPLGQSVAAANLPGAAAGGVLPAPLATGRRTAGLACGVPVRGFALLRTAVAGAIMLRTARDGLPFSLAWRSCACPVGTCVTGTSRLVLATGAGLFRGVAAAGVGGLAAAWLIAAARTAGSLRRDRVFRPAAQ